MTKDQAKAVALALADAAVEIDNLADVARVDGNNAIAAFYATLARGVRDAARDMVNPPVVITAAELGIDATPSDG